MSQQTRVLARKWRPTQFSEIIGQLSIVQTLSNAVSQGRIHQAYLFTGSRGIGKTSIARIFAKALRCENLTLPSPKDPWLYTCGKCVCCTEITQGNHVDVLEIDGASNNGVDAVREIRENAKYLPSSGSKKIYIIDEVHMLTTAAFNALLKTLEEPPPHVIFIFATTEPHKIPATILSRCQRFDFKRATQTQLESLLSRVAEAEGIQCEPNVLSILARAAEGGMRDALSLLDQAIAFEGNKLTQKAVQECMGHVGVGFLISILESTLKQDTQKTIFQTTQAYNQGLDLKLLCRGLMDLLHILILLRAGMTNADIKNQQLTSYSTDELKILEPLSSLRSLSDLEWMFQVLHQTYDWMARSPQPKAILDIALIKCISTNLTLNSKDSKNSEGLEKQQVSAPQQSNLNKNWENFIQFTSQSRKLLSATLEHAILLKFPDQQSQAPSTLEIGFSPEQAYHQELLQTQPYQEQLSELTQKYFNQPIKIRIIKTQLNNTETLAYKREQETTKKEIQTKNLVSSHPIISEARSLFGGTLGSIETLS